MSPSDIEPASYISNRTKKFWSDIIKSIPRFPNDKDAKLYLENKSLQELLIHYFNWRSRFVSQRPRHCVIALEARQDPRWGLMQVGINRLENAVVKGDSLTPFLSLEPRTKGVRASPVLNTDGVEERWSDKDQVLNIMGFHHFHLGPAQRSFRSNELAFAKVSREQFELLSIFDHSVFMNGTDERAKLHRLHEFAITNGESGFFLISNVSLSGHSTVLVMYAMDCFKLIRQHDSHLDEPNYLENALGAQPIPNAKNQKLEWHLRDLDFGLWDKSNNVFYMLKKGWQ